MDQASVIIITLYSRHVQTYRSLLKLALRKQYHRIMQEVLLTLLLTVHDACLIYFLNQNPVFKIIVKIPIVFKGTEKQSHFLITYFALYILRFIYKCFSMTIELDLRKLDFRMYRAKCSIEADWYVLIQITPQPRATITHVQCLKFTQCCAYLASHATVIVWILFSCPLGSCVPLWNFETIRGSLMRPNWLILASLEKNLCTLYTFNISWCIICFQMITL